MQKTTQIVLTKLSVKTGEDQDEKISIDCFGELLGQAWSYKRGLSDKVSNPAIDEIYRTALSAGAIGGKLLGAGGGGFILFFVRPQNQSQVLKALKGLVHVPFSFDSSGSKVVLYQPDGL